MKFTSEQFKILEALWASVEHWLQNWQDIRNAHIDSGHCPLCQYTTEPGSIAIDCKKCPVMWKTGLSNCRGTPWDNASWALDEYDYTSSRAHFNWTKEAFEREYKFLVDLALEYSKTCKIEREEPEEF